MHEQFYPSASALDFDYIIKDYLKDTIHDMKGSL